MAMKTKIGHSGHSESYQNPTRMGDLNKPFKKPGNVPEHRRVIISVVWPDIGCEYTFAETSDSANDNDEGIQNICCREEFDDSPYTYD